MKKSNNYVGVDISKLTFDVAFFFFVDSKYKHHKSVITKKALICY